MDWNNSQRYLTFLLRIVVFSVILGLMTTGLRFLVPAHYITPTLPWLFVFFIVVTITGYYFILRSSNTKFIRFINSYLLVTVVKLFLFIGAIFIYLLNNRQDAAAFAISFFILYFCYMIFEVVNLVSFFKSSKR
jgi:hypothetical protein